MASSTNNANNYLGIGQPTQRRFKTAMHSRKQVRMSPIQIIFQGQPFALATNFRIKPGF